ncbi:hypothetical protein EJB05_19295, partial [Eragrostis curvula]
LPPPLRHCPSSPSPTRDLAAASPPQHLLSLADSRPHHRLASPLPRLPRTTRESSSVVELYEVKDANCIFVFKFCTPSEEARPLDSASSSFCTYDNLVATKKFEI